MKLLSPTTIPRTTLGRLQELAQEIPTLRYYTNPGPNGFGYAVRYGLERYQGDCVAVMMADLSDDPADLVRYYHKMQEGYDCVFGSRWVKGGRVLKAIVRGYSYAVVPNSWTNRKYGESKLKIKEMGSRYFFIMMYCLIEKYFSRGDFHKERVKA
jgi:glycosyltransferase involved in cell wall biosynthesis